MNWKYLIRAMALALYALAGSAAADKLPGDSLYQLHAALITQAATPATLDTYRGHPVIVSMFYGSCGYTCPTLIRAIQQVELGLDPASRAQLRVLLVSIDPQRDTPAALAQLAEKHHADLARWTFARADDADVRKIAAVLGIRYRKLPDGDFNHSSEMILLDETGRMLARSTKLVGGDKDFLARLRSVTGAAACPAAAGASPQAATCTAGTPLITAEPR